MRKVFLTLTGLALCAASNLYAAGPLLTKVNRFFGLGWGDGYHVGWNECAGCNDPLAAGGSCAPVAGATIKNSALPQSQKSAPAATARDMATQAYENRRSQIVTLFPPPSRFFLAPTAQAAVGPRLVRLPPVAEVSRMARRLPPVTESP